MRRWVLLVTAAALVGVAAELTLLGVLIWRIGLPWTLALLIAKSVAGYLVVRRAGQRGWRQFRAAVDSGRAPGREASHATVGVAGGMLILLAGFLGAVTGAVLLVPAVRRAVTHLAERMVERRISTVVAGGMFGPRRVNAERVNAERVGPRAAEPAGAEPAGAGPAGAGRSPAEPAGGSGDPAAGPPPAIEGEILPPR